MNESTILDAVEARKENPDKAVRVLMFAGMGAPSAFSQDDLHKKACAILHMSEEDYRNKFREQYAWWNEKQNRAANILIGSDWMKNFLRQNGSLFSSSSITRDNACYLTTDLLSMALQKESLLDLKNHLKNKEILQLLNWLENPERLQKYRRDFLAPILQAAKKKYSPASDDYILRSLLASEILADYLHQQAIDPSAARTRIGLESLHVLMKSDVETISEFLNGQPVAEYKEEEKDEDSIRIRT